MGLYEGIRWILLGTLLIAMYYAVSMFTMKRNIIKVIKIFEEQKALSTETAVKIESLGIRKQGIFERAVKQRDNRIHALQFLINSGPVKVMPDGRCYLNKTKMATLRRDGNGMTRFIIPPS